MQSKLAVAATLCIALAACAQSGQRQQALKDDLQATHSREQAAWSAYRAGEDGEAIGIWQDLVRQAEQERADHLDYYSNMRYLDTARYLSSIGWANLTAGQLRKARTAYDSAFSALYDGEQGHRQVMVLDNQARHQQLQTTLMVGSYLSNQGNTPGIRALAQNLTSYIRSHGSQPDAVASANAPELFDGLDQLSSDGIRLNILPAGPPLTNIGRFRSGGGYCTASLIGWRIAVTNAHCVSEGDKNTPFWPFRDADSMLVSFESVETPDTVPVTDIVTSSKNTSQDGWVHRDWSNDWALLVLERHPVRRGFLGVVDRDDSPAVGSRVFLAGYSGDQSDGRFLSVNWGCTIHRLTPTLARDNCRSYSGSSGSPMLFTDGGFEKFYVYGLHAFGSANRQNPDGSKRTSERGGGPRAAQFIDTLQRLRDRLGNDKIAGRFQP